MKEKIKSLSISNCFISIFSFIVAMIGTLIFFKVAEPWIVIFMLPTGLGLSMAMGTFSEKLSFLQRDLEDKGLLKDKEGEDKELVKLIDNIGHQAIWSLFISFGAGIIFIMAISETLVLFVGVVGLSALFIFLIFSFSIFYNKTGELDTKLEVLLKDKGKEVK